MLMKSVLSVSFATIGLSFAYGLTTSTAAFAASLSHLYSLNNSLADDLGGPSLTADDDATISPGGYAFDANEGPSLSGALANNSEYSILVDFSLANTEGFRKIIDFKNRASDDGVYNRDQALRFFGASSSTTSVFTPNILARLIVTRDAASKQFSSYVNGIPGISFDDTSDLAIFNATGNIINFFIDDTAIGGEASAGLVTKIALYDGVLTAAEVAALGAAGSPIGGDAIPVGGGDAIPTPALLPGLIGMGATAYRKRKGSATAQA